MELNPTAVVSTSRTSRIIDLDVTRAVALIGVALMNYQGYLMRGDTSKVGESLINHLFDPWRGPLSTRFAATFVTVAGMGVTLMTNRARLSGDRPAIDQLRWVLVRRGLLLYAFGAALEWIWNGTIIFFYGAYFMVAATLFTLRTRWLAAIGVGAVAAAHAVQWWAMGRQAGWLFRPNGRSIRGLLFNTVINGTHPLLPWMGFFVLGMILGRLTPWTTVLRVQLAFAGLLAIVAGYGIRAMHSSRMSSTEPFSRTAVYTLTAAGAAVVAIAVVGGIAQATSNSVVTRSLAAAGRMTLTLYIGHVLFFNLVVNRLGWVGFAGLDVAAALALGYWLVAVIAAVFWQRRFGLGPAERWYRNFGG